MPHYPRHLPAFRYIGFHRYHVRFCTYDRARHFCAAMPVSLVMRQIQHAAALERMAVPAYCFMPDHLHLLLEGTAEDADLKAFIVRIKRTSAYHFRRATGVKLWQSYCFERVLRADEPRLRVARYIVENPVRAGLVRAPEQYPFWGSLTYTREALLESIRRDA